MSFCKLRTEVFRSRGDPPSSEQKKTQYLCYLGPLPLSLSETRRHFPSIHTQTTSSHQRLKRASINPRIFLTKRQQQSPGPDAGQSCSHGLSKGQDKRMAPRFPWGVCLNCPQLSGLGSQQQPRTVTISAWPKSPVSTKHVEVCLQHAAVQLQSWTSTPFATVSGCSPWPVRYLCFHAPKPVFTLQRSEQRMLG